ncbi:MmgE/PrpD family protein [Actinoplanes bogorensis]|uniref:MmgE/PrpD family protein n=1 Tax=Paractinoplanes bogorensis TaxID=1610840 RepID=A0ABS5YUP8_9ACTN|nr:MmgE/PrpD family protein [Actinoplanes bogorensis]MBU2667184.1 MmgE/PrpD family protein [Actinoplanes bogorensis]
MSADTLAARISAAVLEDQELPDSVRRKAREHSLDALGTARAAAGFPFAKAIVDGAAALEPSPPSGPAATGLNSGRTFSPERAALVNGTMIHGLDFDDTHIAGIYHATAPALAAALAVGESVGASRGQILDAYALGLEVGCRLSLAAPGAFHSRGFHPTGVIGAFAAACVAARLRGVPADVLANALGLSGSMAAGILEIKGSWLKRLHPGWAASSGITAVTLAQAGFAGPPAVFEGPLGLFRSHTEQLIDPDQVMDGFGTRWDLLDLALKPYPCCHFLHACADAAIALRDEVGSPDRVERIEVLLHESLFEMVVEPVAMRRAPRNAYDALFSVQYVTGVAFADGDVTLRRFYDGLDDPAVLAWSTKVDTVPDPRSDYPKSFPGEVAVHLTDGTVRRARVEHSRGTVENPLDRAALITKFTANGGDAAFAADWLDGGDR